MMRTDDCERKMVDCPYCGKAFNVPTVEQQLTAAEKRAKGAEDRVVTHAANCNYWTDHDDADCTCGVDWKIRWQTEREMYKAWRKRAEEAEAWKESMLSVMPPMQEIGNELGVLLGDSIHDKILSGIKTLKAQLAILKPCVELYATEEMWSALNESPEWLDYWTDTDHGYEPAQEALAKVEEIEQ